MRRAPRIMISAGEASGDRLGAGLALALKRRRPDVELLGMGGERMAAAGVEILQDSAEVAVVGIFEVVAHLRQLLRARDRLIRALGEVDLLVPVDFPDFNLNLAARARRLGRPVVYFVSPQIWAWRRGRVRRIHRLVRRMLVLFPFEVPFYEQAGVPVTFVGHPAVEPRGCVPDTDALRHAAGLDSRHNVIALLPGSRRSEISRLLPVMLGAAELLLQARPGLQFLLPLAPGVSRAWIEERLSATGVAVRMHAGDFPEILAACDAGAVASGTASLEAALVGLPMVVVYRMAPLSFAVGRALVRVEHIALPNLVAGKRVVPELVQHACTPRVIAEHVGRFLDHPEERRRVRDELAEVRRRLGGPGVFERAAEAVLAELPADGG